MAEIKEHTWFKQDYTPATPEEDDDDVHIDDEALSITEVLYTKYILRMCDSLIQLRCWNEVELRKC